MGGHWQFKTLGYIAADTNFTVGSRGREPSYTIIKTK